MIIYFSGTGNSKYVAEQIADSLEDNAVSIEEGVCDIKLREGEPFGIVVPTHWLELPIPVRSFLTDMKLTLSKDNYIFVVATYGTSPGCIGEDTRRLLLKKEIVLDGAFSVCMPDTWTPIFDLSDPDKVASQNEKADESLAKVIDMIKAKEKGDKTENRTPHFLKPLTNAYLNFESRTKNFYVEDSCIGCGLCAEKCPVKAIEIKDDKPVWTKKNCAICLRCLHHCPEFVIQYGNGKTKQHGQYRNPNVSV